MMQQPYRVYNPNFWRDKSPGWEERTYGEAVDGKGDLGFNTCDEIERKKDKSAWAYYALEECQELLQMELRWPNSMNQDIDAKSRFEWRMSNIPFKIKKLWVKFLEWRFPNYDHKIVPMVKYRVQNRLTRDPYVAFYTACMVLDVPELIEDTPPVGYVYRPAFWNWYKYLETRNEKYLKRYRFWSWFSFSKKDYVNRLDELREIAIALAQQS